MEGRRDWREERLEGGGKGREEGEGKDNVCSSKEIHTNAFHQIRTNHTNRLTLNIYNTKVIKKGIPHSHWPLHTLTGHTEHMKSRFPTGRRSDFPVQLEL